MRSRFNAGQGLALMPMRLSRKSCDQRRTLSASEGSRSMGSDKQQNRTIPAGEAVVSRPGGWQLVMAVMFLVGAFLQIFDPSSVSDLGRPQLYGQTLMLLVLSALFGAPVLWMRVIAAPDGLRWRKGLHWRFAPWADVRDYYNRSTVKGAWSASVKTQAGEVIEIAGDWRGVSTLRDAIEERADQARAKGWGTPGLRATETWPLCFEYPVPAPILLKQYTWLSIALCVFTILALPGAVILVVPIAGFIALAARNGREEIRNHARDIITVSPDGIAFEDGVARVYAPWNSVRDYYLTHPAYWTSFALHRHVVTSNGTFTYTSGLVGARFLDAIITHFATDVLPLGWESETQVLGGERSRWALGPGGETQRVYHYRTSSNLLWLFMVAMLLPVLLGVVWILGPPPDAGELAMPICVSLVGTVLLIACLAASVRTDESGITQRSFWMSRRLAWADVESYSWRQTGLLRHAVVEGRGVRITIWPAIADLQHLQGEIQRRASNSKTKQGEYWS